MEAMPLHPGPVSDDRNFIPRQSRFRMKQSVSRQRHLFGLDGDPNHGQVSFALGCGILRPMGKIHLRPGLADVVLDHPRNRRHLSVPRPDGLVGMTIPARPLENLHDIGSGLCAGEQRPDGLRCAILERMDQRGRERQGRRESQEYLKGSCSESHADETRWMRDLFQPGAHLESSMRNHFSYRRSNSRNSSPLTSETAQ